MFPGAQVKEWVREWKDKRNERGKLGREEKKGDGGGREGAIYKGEGEAGREGVHVLSG